jgi:hypothetical protein
MPIQAARTIMMVRPKHFGFDSESALSNPFQVKEGAEDRQQIQELALNEFDNAVLVLQAAGISVIVIEDTESPIKPNAIFPNNWVSFHEDMCVLYPMMAVNRRAEKRKDVFHALNKLGLSNERVEDLSKYETDNKFLEGTGSIIFDHKNNLAYASKSERTNIEVLTKLCDLIGFRPVFFDSFDKDKLAIYHTNVMMCLANEYCVICLESISDLQKIRVIRELEESNHEIIEITMDQMYAFAGNMFEVENGNGESILVMSEAAQRSLNSDQLNRLTHYSKLLKMPIPTIEKYGGGSIRCMMCRLN